MTETYVKNNDEKFSVRTEDAFDPAVLARAITDKQAEIQSFKDSLESAIMAAQVTTKQTFQPEIDAAEAQLAALQSKLEAFEAAFPDWKPVSRGEAIAS